MKMKLKDGKVKVITLSYDDGVVQDIKLIEIMDKYGLKGTFNLNPGSYVPEDGERTRQNRRLKLSESIELYKDSVHEIAVHGYTHPFFEKLDTCEMIYEITEARKALEAQYGRITRGMAYPFGTYNDDVIDVLEKCHIAYARTVNNTYKFDFPQNWLTLHPTCQHSSQRLEELITSFVEKPVRGGNAQMFYLWGHSYEFDDNNNWDVIEKFAQYAGGREDIWYATNIEIYDYVQAYKRLEMSYDKKIIHNPSSMDVWFEVVKDETLCIKGGETLYL